MTDEDVLADEFPDLGPPPTWMQITIQVPMNEGIDILGRLRALYGFYDVDWCVLGRDEDNARADCAPCEPLTQKPPN